MRFGSLFSGAGLLDCGLAQAGIEHAWFVEREPDRRSLLSKRWPGVPVHDDVRTVGAHNLERVDGIAGGFPCKGVSGAGLGTGLAHPETALWAEFARIVGEMEPRFVLVENVARILTLHGGDVLRVVVGDLAALGFDVAWDCVPAAATGACHLRDRWFAFASHPARLGHERSGASRQRWTGPADDRQRTQVAADAARLREGRANETYRSDGQRTRQGVDVAWGGYDPAIRRWEAVHGAAPAPLTRVRGLDDGDTKLQRLWARMDRQRLSACGDGVHVAVARLAGDALMELSSAVGEVRHAA